MGFVNNTQDVDHFAKHRVCDGSGILISRISGGVENLISFVRPAEAHPKPALNAGSSFFVLINHATLQCGRSWQDRSRFDASKNGYHPSLTPQCASKSTRWTRWIRAPRRLQEHAKENDLHRNGHWPGGLWLIWHAQNAGHGFACKNFRRLPMASSIPSSSLASSWRLASAKATSKTCFSKPDTMLAIAVMMPLLLSQARAKPEQWGVRETTRHTQPRERARTKRPTQKGTPHVGPRSRSFQTSAAVQIESNSFH